MTVNGPEDTFSSFLMCSFRRFGCSWSASWLPGGEQRAQAARLAHERECRYRFHAR